MASAKKTIPLLLAAVVTGCSGVVPDAARTLVFEPLRFHPEANRHRERKWYRRLADSALHEALGASDGALSRDYARGFKEGYVDYLESGGDGEPPAVPPRDYWGHKTPWWDRQAAAAEWFEGFRDGAAAAMASGYREQILVPSSCWAPGCFEPP
jgi:hypothetical protein